MGFLGGRTAGIRIGLLGGRKHISYIMQQQIGRQIATRQSSPDYAARTYARAVSYLTCS
jgi:hypothetical protein